MVGRAGDRRAQRWQRSRAVGGRNYGYSVAVIGEHRYGERARLALEQLPWHFQTCADAGWLARAFETSRRREVVPWSYHREVAALPAPVADELLDRVEANWREHRATLTGDRPSVGGIEQLASVAFGPVTRSGDDQPP